MGGWQKIKMDDLIDEISMGPFGSDIKVSCFVERGIPVLNGSNLFGTRLKEDSFRYVTPEKADSLKKANAYRGDVIVTHRGTLGQIVYIPQNSTQPRYVISQSQFRFRCNDKVIPEYVVNYFHSHEGQNKILANASQVGVPALARASSSFRDIEIPVPPLPTQRKIAAVLGALDDKIENNRKICANLEAQAQAIFKSWFVAPRKESEWFSENKDNNHVWVSIADMGSCGAFIFDSSEYLTDEAIRSFNFKVVPQDTVLLSFKLTVGRVAIAATDLVTNEAIAHLRSSDTRLKEYLYCYLKQFNYDNLGSTSSIATAVNSTTIKEMPFVVPEDRALNAFHQLVKPLFNQIRVLLFESRALAATRDALLPKLMSGEIDVEKVKVA